MHNLKIFVDRFQIPVLVFCCGALFSLVAFAGWRFAQYYPENHVSIDIRWLYLVCLFGYVFAVTSWVSSGLSKSIFLILFASSLLLLAIACLDYFNLILEYDLWQKRGMPKPFQ